MGWLRYSKEVSVKLGVECKFVHSENVQDMALGAECHLLRIPIFYLFSSKLLALMMVKLRLKAWRQG